MSVHLLPRCGDGNANGAFFDPDFSNGAGTHPDEGYSSDDSDGSDSYEEGVAPTMVVETNATAAEAIESVGAAALDTDSADGGDPHAARIR